MAPRSSPAVLVVDPDRVSSMITARILERARLSVECVTSGVAALELLQQRQTDLVICEATLPDLPTVAFIEAGRQLYAPASLPVLVVTLDLRSRARLELLRAGAIECLSKPVEADELRLRVERALHGPEQREVATGATYLSGDLERVRLGDILAMCELARLSGLLEVANRRQAGRIELQSGRIRHAELGAIQGLEALGEILRLGRGWFRLRAGAPRSPATLDGSTTQLLLELSVEEANRRRSPSGRQRSLDELGVSTARLGASAPELARRVSRLGPLLQDPLRLGELELVPQDHDEVSDDAVVFTVFGELAEVVAALGEISAPIGPGMIAAARAPASRLRWQFHGRERDRLVLRVIGLDESSQAWFELRSDAVIVAVPSAGAGVLDPAVRAYVLSNRLPTMIVARRDEGERLFSPAPFANVQITGKSLGELRGELRGLLVAALLMGARA